MSYAGRIGDLREFAAECDAEFVLEGSLDCLTWICGPLFGW